MRAAAVNRARSAIIAPRRRHESTAARSPLSGLAAELAAAPAPDSRVVRPASSPLHPTGGVLLAQGQPLAGWRLLKIAGLTNFLRPLAKNDGGIPDGALRSSSSALSGRHFAKRLPVGAETARCLPMNLCYRPRCSYFDEDNMAVVGKGVAVLQDGRVALGGVL
jgi:hypothetical protein